MQTRRADAMTVEGYMTVLHFIYLLIGWFFVSLTTTE
jgi:hypothetical protein